MFTAACSLRSAVARTGNYAVRPSILRCLMYFNNLISPGYSAVLDREEHEQQSQRCVLNPRTLPKSFISVIQVLLWVLTWVRRTHVFLSWRESRLV